eukprot:TRINITY_DN6628_c1_g3_i1.p1 TRINITY_DN6628_c1_g3~~TRINITY_DN6628_c1_g3_i1.p1  ORF type:complete len:598 (+),score=149.88 TRINITY_DN6628_c1_g3_i1:85-1878(+)
MRWLPAAVLLLTAGAFSQKYAPNWQSLNSRPIPSWYDDVKFGIFIHWGVYSVPSWAPVGTYAEWYWHSLSNGPSDPTYQFHVKTYGQNFMYQDFAPMWRAELWDPDQWADLFVRSGAKYVVPTSKHHEGFTLWRSNVSWNWNAVESGPHRDLLGDLMAAVKARGLHASLYFSLYEWYNPLYLGPQPHLYVDEVMLPQLYDLASNYQPDLIFTDGEWDHPSSFWNSTEFLAWLFNDSPIAQNVVINDRWGSETRGVDGGYYSPEYGDTVYLDHKWELNRGIDVFSFGLNRNSQAGNYTTSEAIVHILIRTVANGGNLLLDVGPASDGEIPVVMQERLLDVGAWLQVNGDAIYNTRPWVVQNEPSNTTFFTMRPDLNTTYAIFTVWPDNDTVAVPFVSSVSNVALLGYSGTVKYTVGSAGLIVTLPAFTSPFALPCSFAWTLRLSNAVGPGATAGLQQWFGGTNGHDNALCGTSGCGAQLQTAGYVRHRYEGLALVANDTATMSLDLYYSSKYSDYALVAADHASVLDSTYAFVGHQGFAFPQPDTPGTIPLELWHNDALNDYYTLGSSTSRQEAQNEKYTFVGVQGYVYPGANYWLAP